MEHKTVEETLESLKKLQSIDSQLDEIKRVRGDLPEEVRDLEDELIGYQTRLDKFNEAIAGLEANIENRNQISKEAQSLIEKYNSQQDKVRNNREFDAISKEMELQELEIQISEKKIGEYNAQIEQKKEQIEKIAATLADRQKDLDGKKSELEDLVKESEEEEVKLDKARKKAEGSLEQRLSIAYNRIRDNAKNGLAVVTVRRNACGGCFNTVPPQKQADVAQKKKLLVCEHCGRIFADVEIVLEPVKKKRTTRRTKKEA